MLVFDDVSFSYQRPAAKLADLAGSNLLSSISFNLDASEHAILLGNNGAGKSTLLRLSNGLLRPARGRVRVCGLDTGKAKTSAIACKAGFLFQNPDRQICQSSVREELLFSLKVKGHHSDDAASSDACEKVLDELGLDGDANPFSLSRGMRQYVALASVLVCDPQLLLLDEPTAWLDKQQASRLLSTLYRRQQAGSAILTITHDLQLARRYATRVFELSEGRLDEKGVGK